MPFTRLPKRRERPRMGVKDEVRRVFEGHRAFLRRHQCVIVGCSTGSPIEVAHLRTAANSGTGLKPSDDSAVPMCAIHHHDSHARGHATVAAENGMTLEQLFQIAALFARLTPDKALRAFLRERAEENRG